MTDVRTGQRFGSGSSSAVEPADAARESIGQALDGRTPGPDDLVVVFPTIQYNPHEFLEAAMRAAAPAQVVGCSSYAAFTDAVHVGQGAAAIYIPAAELTFGVARVDSLSVGIFDAAQQATELARDRAGGEGENSALLVLSSGMAGDLREVARGSYAVTGAMVPLVGGAAADDGSMLLTHQFAEGEVMSDGLVAVWINSPEPLGVGVEHGWYPIGEPMIVTRAEGNILYELDGQPAVDVYLSHRGALLPSEIAGQREASFARATYDHPLGVATASGRFEVRHILDRADNGGMVMFGYMNEQSVVQVMAGNSDDLINAAGRATEEAVSQLSGPPRGALVFSCTGRIEPLESRVPAEAAAVTQGLGGMPIGGFYTYGEFARVTGSTGFHNATVVVLAF